MPLADDLEKEVGSIGAEGQVAEFVADKQVRALIIVKLFKQGVIGLCGAEVVDHVDGGGEQRLDIGVAGGIGKGLGKKGFAGAGVSNEDDIGVLLDEVEVEEIEDGGFLLFPAYVVMEVELVDGEFFGQARLLKPALDGPLPSLLGLELDQSVQHEGGIVVFFPGLLQDGIKVFGHGFESEIYQGFADGFDGMHGPSLSS